MLLLRFDYILLSFDQILSFSHKSFDKKSHILFICQVGT